MNKKLNNPKFVENAPKDILDKAKKQRNEDIQTLEDSKACFKLTQIKQS